jgi:hypothetical protein
MTMLSALPLLLTVSLNWTAFGEQVSSSKADVVALDETFNPFGTDQDETSFDVCYQGDINQVCSLLAKMSKLSGEKYSSGDHGLAELKGCRILGRKAPVQAVIELSDDYDDGVRKVTAIIGACAQ